MNNTFKVNFKYRPSQLFKNHRKSEVQNFQKAGVVFVTSLGHSRSIFSQNFFENVRNAILFIKMGTSGNFAVMWQADTAKTGSLHLHSQNLLRRKREIQTHLFTHTFEVHKMRIFAICYICEFWPENGT